MTIFEGLLLAHLLGDWILQTEWMAQNKAHNWRALLSHVVVYHAIVLAVLMFGFGLRGISVFVVVAVLAVIHIVLDKRTFVMWLMRALRITVNRTPEFWLVMAVDQSIHLLALGGAAVVISGFPVL